MREREREARGVGIATAREGRTGDRLTATHDGRFLAGVNSIRDSSKKRGKKKKASGNGSVEERNVDRGLERRGSWSKGS